ncbi:ribosomal protein L1-like protein [Pelagophyceae sp. CCMP2097]|nr:ribosomal protein L1-like protein [Pelagophyceae sp. CCMP2097]
MLHAARSRLAFAGHARRPFAQPAYLKRGVKKEAKVKIILPNIREAIEQVIQGATNSTTRKYKSRRFDEGIDLDIVVSLDPRKPDQSVKSVVEYPHGTGKTKKLAVFVDDDDAEGLAAAKEAGADVIGGQDLIDAVVGGEIDFEAAVCTKKMLSALKKAARVLGPRGLMPGPRNPGTVAETPDELTKVIAAFKRGRVLVKTEPKKGLIHAPLGRVSFGAEKIVDNLRALMHAIQAAKPEKAPGKFFLSASISSSMGKGCRIEISTIDPSSSKFLIAALEEDKPPPAFPPSAFPPQLPAAAPGAAAAPASPPAAQPQEAAAAS